MGRKPKVKGSIINNEIICQNSQSKYTNLQQKKYLIYIKTILEYLVFILIPHKTASHFAVTPFQTFSINYILFSYYLLQK